MRDCGCCISENAVQVCNQSSSSNSSSNGSSPQIVPAIQNIATCLYTTTLSTQKHFRILLKWTKNPSSQTLTINFNQNPLTEFIINTNPGLFRSPKGSKSIDLYASKIEAHWDLSIARFTGPEPVSGFYLIIVIDSEPGLVLGDMAQEWLSKKVKIMNCGPKFALLSRKEEIYGNSVYSTKAKFCEEGIVHDILISCRRNLVLSVIVDGKLVVRVRRLEWNFRGNQTIYLDGLIIDLTWDVHDWLHQGNGGDPGAAAVFMFRTRGMGTRLWLEEKDDHHFGFSLAIYAYRNT